MNVVFTFTRRANELEKTLALGPVHNGILARIRSWNPTRAAGTERASASDPKAWLLHVFRDPEAKPDAVMAALSELLFWQVLEVKTDDLAWLLEYIRALLNTAEASR